MEHGKHQTYKELLKQTREIIKALSELPNTYPDIKVTCQIKPDLQRCHCWINAKIFIPESKATYNLIFLFEQQLLSLIKINLRKQLHQL